jgi:hypothetical protein
LETCRLDLQIGCQEMTPGLILPHRFPRFRCLGSLFVQWSVRMKGINAVRLPLMEYRFFRSQVVTGSAMKLECPRLRDSWQRIKMRIQLPVPLIVALGFAVPMLLVLALVFLFGNGTTPEEACRKECAAKNRFSRLTYKYPPEMTAGTRRSPPTQCECY